MIRPPRLEPSCRVCVVAASGPVDRERFEAGARVLSSRYRLHYDESILFARDGFLAGQDGQRLAALNAALADADCRAIVLARGGYGLTRILPEIDRDAFRARPKPIVGYSDATALLAWSVQTGVAAVHGPMVSDLGDLETEDHSALIRLLEESDPGVVLDALEELVPGRSEGTLLGGNLEVLSRLLGTPWQPDFDGAILFLEETGELPYRVDRLLTHLEMAGVLAAVSGVVVGDFTDCDDAEEDALLPTALTVVRERLARLAVPVVLGGAFGHGHRKLSLPYGTTAQLDTRTGQLVATEGAVS